MEKYEYLTIYNLDSLDLNCLGAAWKSKTGQQARAQNAALDLAG